jgi:hypothetical protein
MSDYKLLRVVLRATFVLAGLIFLSQGAWADAPYSFIRIQCMGAINRLEVSTFITWNVCDVGCSQAAPLARQGIYELRKFIQQYSKHPFECDLGAGQKAVVSILDHWPGRDLPGMEFDVSVDDRRVVPPQRLDGASVSRQERCVGPAHQSCVGIYQSLLSQREGSTCASRFDEMRENMGGRR